MNGGYVSPFDSGYRQPESFYVNCKADKVRGPRLEAPSVTTTFRLFDCLQVLTGLAWGASIWAGPQLPFGCLLNCKVPLFGLINQGGSAPLLTADKFGTVAD